VVTTDLRDTIAHIGETFWAALRRSLAQATDRSHRLCADARAAPRTRISFRGGKHRGGFACLCLLEQGDGAPWPAARRAERNNPIRCGIVGYERGEIHVVQSADARAKRGGELSLLYHRPQCGRGRCRSPAESWRRSCTGEDSADHVEFVDIAGLVAGDRRAGGGDRQQFLAAIREVGCHRARGAIFEGTTDIIPWRARSIRQEYGGDQPWDTRGPIVDRWSGAIKKG